MVDEAATMQSVVLAAAAVAAVVHVAFFVMESIVFMRPAVWSRFATSEASATVLRPVFWNQGFYNLFLAIGAAIGVALLAAGAGSEAGTALVAFTCASMFGAALVLLSTGREYLAGAVVQGLPPLVALVALLAHLRA